MDTIELHHIICARVAAHCAKYQLDPEKYKWDTEWDYLFTSIFSVNYGVYGSLDTHVKDVQTCVFDKLNLDSTHWIVIWSFTLSNIDWCDNRHVTHLFRICCVNMRIDSDQYGHFMELRPLLWPMERPNLHIAYHVNNYCHNHYIPIPYPA